MQARIHSRLATCALTLTLACSIASCGGDDARDGATTDDGGAPEPAQPAQAGSAGAAAGSAAAGAGRGGAPDPVDGGAQDGAVPQEPECAPPSPADDDNGGAAPFDPDAPYEPGDVAAHAFFTIRVIDRATSTPLAGARLETTNAIVLHSDRNGLVAFYEPGLMGLETFFEVTHPGHEIAADGFGIRGVRLQVVEGGTAEVALDAVASAAAPAVDDDLHTRLAAGPVPGPDACCAIVVVDRQTRRGVPLVSVATAGEVYWTDSNGVVAYCNPDHVGDALELEVRSHGYHLDGGPTRTLTLAGGGSVLIELERDNAAERLYRLTGQGIYRDSALLGLAVPTAEPLINGLVMGQDTVQATPYRDRIFWVWGDTSRPSYPLGNFHTSSARSELPGAGGLLPGEGIDFTYFVGDDGFSKQMAPVETVPGEGVTWLGALVAVPDASGQPRLFARYGLFASDSEQSEAGLVRFDDDRELFEKVLVFSDVEAVAPLGHPTRVQHEAGEEYVYYHPPLRVPARAEALLDPAQYEAFTAYEAGSSSTLERNALGEPSYGWKRGSGYTTRAALQAEGFGAEHDFDGHVQDAQDGTLLTVHGNSSKTWNAHRRRFVQMVAQVYGATSFLGEIWYAEADTPLGPWVYARKIVTHDEHTFYNPRQHPFFDRSGGRLVFFEGTHTITYSEAEPTPRYDYNQLMYRLDLDDPRLVLPVPVYAIAGSDPDAPIDFATKQDLPQGLPAQRAVFFAPDRAAADLVPVGWSAPACAAQRRLVVGSAALAPLFHALAPDSTELSARAVALHEYAAPDGRTAYGLDGAVVPSGFERSAQPLAFVWTNPIAVPLPVGDFLGDVIAAAGPDQCVSEQRAGAGAEITLDASASASTAGAIESYAWIVPHATGCTRHAGARVQITLPAGSHAIRLDVTTADGQTDSDTLLVQVGEP